ncbi:tetratricopeptide repeat protein [Paraflavisolibacter sp. H34]|uniref:tetratricopeptide repeat protein n=1 Tax=Huijunlia imazamoxiresistens TaxID=3127457 RepID=UPI003017628B
MVDVSLFLQRAELLLQQGRVKDAEVAVKQALAQEPNNGDALCLLARCCFGAQRYDEGILLLQQAIALDPENSYFYYLLGFAHYHQGQLGPAKEAGDIAIQLAPYCAEYYGMYAFFLLEEKAFEPALAKADEGLAQDPENLTCLNARSRALNKLRRTEAAIETMQEALAQDPDNEITHATVGWNFLEKGKHQLANQHFLEALRINPNQESSRRGLKESLKSKVPPYRWMLQYSFWLSDKGKKMQTFLPIALYIVFRILINVFEKYEHTNSLAWLLMGVYILLVVTSWSINSIANFFLLFHPVGKHALTASERWSSLSVVTALVAGLTAVGLSFTDLAAGTAYGSSLFFAGLVSVSLALPLGEMEYPVRWAGKGWRGKATVVLAVLGLLTLLVYAVAPLQYGLFVLYGVLFILYNWSGLAR